MLLNKQHRFHMSFLEYSIRKLFKCTMHIAMKRLRTRSFRFRISKNISYGAKGERARESEGESDTHTHEKKINNEPNEMREIAFRKMKFREKWGAFYKYFCSIREHKRHLTYSHTLSLSVTLATKTLMVLLHSENGEMTKQVDWQSGTLLRVLQHI